MPGIVRRIGWEKDEETGLPVFRAIVEYPNGPPSLPFAVVWGKIPVEIVVIENMTQGVDAPSG